MFLDTSVNEKPAVKNYSLIKNDSLTNSQSLVQVSVIQNHMVETESKGFHAILTPVDDALPLDTRIET